MAQGYEVVQKDWCLAYVRLNDRLEPQETAAHYSYFSLNAYVGGHQLNVLPMTEREAREAIESALMSGLADALANPPAPAVV